MFNSRRNHTISDTSVCSRACIGGSIFFIYIFPMSMNAYRLFICSIIYSVGTVTSNLIFYFIISYSQISKRPQYDHKKFPQILTL